MRELSLNNGVVAYVDDEDYERVAAFRWLEAIRPHTSYAQQSARSSLLMHRFILGAAHGQRIDHRDGNGLNNTRRNLRPCSHRQNMANRIKHAAATSRFKGIYFYKRSQKWIARAGEKWIGQFSSEVEAARAYDVAAIALYGEFARLNFTSPSAPSPSPCGSAEQTPGPGQPPASPQNG